MSSALTLQPIGYVRTEKPLKFHARHQPVETAAERNVLELLPDCNYEQALRDLAGFSRVWLVWWFHRNNHWRPLVIPPRGPSQRRGVFATRSPHRPNPLGLTPVQLLGIEGRKLILGPCDLIDGTPVFDIKPYVAAYDAFPEAKGGWIDEVDVAMSTPPPYTVMFAAEAETHRDWLRNEWQIDFTPRLIELLARDPSPHRTRRIRKRSSHFEISCGAWRALYTVDAKVVTVLAFEPGYPTRFLNNAAYEDMPDRAAQLAFYARWLPEVK